MPEYEMVPPDGGWGWLVLLGSTSVNILVPGTIKSFGVLFVEFLDTFNASPTAASFIPALCYFLYSSLGPLSSILSVKYSYRTVTIIGGAFAAIGMILSFWASSVTYLYFSYGILVGAGAGLSFPPTVYIVTSYFVRLRGLANGLCISGSAFGSIILPPVLRWLLEEYGYRGAILIMGGITLNVFVAALFYEPVEMHMKRVLKKTKALEDIEEEDAGIILKFNSNAEENLNLTSNDSQLDNFDDKMKNDFNKQYLINTENNFVKSASAAVVQNIGRTDDVSNKIRKISTPVKVPQRNQTFTTTNLEHGLNHRSNSILQHSRNRLSKRTNSTSSFLYISTPYHGSTLSFQPNLSMVSLKSNASIGKNMSMLGGQEAEIDEKQEPVVKQKIFDLSLLKDPIYLIILISNCSNAISYTNFIILLPAYAVNLDFSKNQAAYLISIVSTTDLIGRIGGSALSDCNFVPKTWYFVGGLLFSGISLAFLPFWNTYIMISVFCALFGLASGSYVGVTSIVMADLLGTNRLTSSYGISLFFNGILQLVGPPICGLWLDYSEQSYGPLFTTLGLALVAGASLWALKPFFKPKKTQDDDEDNYKVELESDVN